jgi:hypothetical protein
MLRMETDRRPPVIDMTPEGEFRDAPGGARALRGSWLDRTLLKLGGAAVLAAVVTGGLALAALAVLFIGLLLPVALVAGLVAFGTICGGCAARAAPASPS